MLGGSTTHRALMRPAMQAFPPASRCAAGALDRVRAKQDWEQGETSLDSPSILRLSMFASASPLANQKRRRPACHVAGSPYLLMNTRRSCSLDVVQIGRVESLSGILTPPMPQLIPCVHSSHRLIDVGFCIVYMRAQTERLIITRSGDVIAIV